MFADAALAMFDILTDVTAVRETEERRIEITGLDHEDLLVGWLGELLSLHDADGLLFGRFQIDEFAEKRLVGSAWGERIDPDRHLLKGELKAVTHHSARIRRDSRGWEARVIFDV